MRREIVEYAKRGDGELKEIVREAVLRLDPTHKPA
jgi:hypothetical protein